MKPDMNFTAPNDQSKDGSSISFLGIENGNRTGNVSQLEMQQAEERINQLEQKYAD